MTDVNGLRLAYRGFVAGLAGGYVWAAIAMLLAALAHGRSAAPLRPIALAITPVAGSPELAFVLGLAAVQAGGAVVGMCFAYFFARFFTVRATLAVAAPVVALLVWGLIASVALARDRPASSPIPRSRSRSLATIGYGLLLGAGVPVRGEVSAAPRVALDVELRLEARARARAATRPSRAARYSTVLNASSSHGISSGRRRAPRSSRPPAPAGRRPRRPRTRPS